MDQDMLNLSVHSFGWETFPIKNIDCAFKTFLQHGGFMLTDTYGESLGLGYKQRSLEKFQ